MTIFDVSTEGRMFCKTSHNNKCSCVSCCVSQSGQRTEEYMCWKLVLIFLTVLLRNENIKEVCLLDKFLFIKYGCIFLKSE